jgi:Tol biopolymer transport system component
MHRRRWRIHRVSVLWMCLIVGTTASCISSSSSSLTSFSSDGNRYNAGAWSPDGRWLAVEGSDVTVIALFSASGQSVNYLHLGCELGAGEEDFAWLPDGRLSCYRAGSASVLHLFTLNRSGQSIHENMIPVPVSSNTFVYGLQWNPRHFWLAVLADSTPGTTTPTLYVSDLAGHRLLAPFALDGAQEMTWSPDGRTLAVVEQSGDVLLLTMQQQASGKLVVAKTRTLAVDTAPDEYVVWSPSGRWLVCRHQTYESEDYLFLLAADGSGKQVKLTSSTTDGQVVAVAWSPDGKQLIVSRVSDGALMSLDIAKLLKVKGVKP